MGETALFLLPVSLNDLSTPLDCNAFISCILSRCTKRNERRQVCVAAVVAAARGSVLHAGVRLAENPPSLLMCCFSGDAAAPCWTHPVGFNWEIALAGRRGGWELLCNFGLSCSGRELPHCVSCLLIFHITIKRPPSISSLITTFSERSVVFSKV